MPEPDIDPFPAPTWRRRLIIAGLAVATAIAVVMTLLYPPGGVQRHKPSPPPPPPDVARCAPGQTEGCVGGAVQVIVAPASAAR